MQIPQHLTLGLGDKALILLGAAARVATRLLLLYGTTLWQMQLMQAPAAIDNQRVRVKCLYSSDDLVVCCGVLHVHTHRNIQYIYIQYNYIYIYYMYIYIYMHLYCVYIFT